MSEVASPFVLAFIPQQVKVTNDQLNFNDFSNNNINLHFDVWKSTYNVYIFATERVSRQLNQSSFTSFETLQSIAFIYTLGLCDLYNCFVFYKNFRCLFAKNRNPEKKNTLKVWLDLAVDVKYNNDKFQRIFFFLSKETFHPFYGHGLIKRSREMVSEEVLTHQAETFSQ